MNLKNNQIDDRDADGSEAVISKVQADYYGELLKQYGPGVDAVASGAMEYKLLRYEKLSQVFGDDNVFSIHDVGMGLGHYYEYLKKTFCDRKIDYSGSEIVHEFHDHCVQKYPECDFFERDLATCVVDDSYDYVVFGGTFYHQRDVARGAWEKYIQKMLMRAFSMTRKGLAFNLITQYCDYYDRGLYYANINKIVDFVVGNLSRFFKVDHAYPLYECTFCVYKEGVVKDKYKGDEYSKYFKTSK